jgi:hypothetical protein
MKPLDIIDPLRKTDPYIQNIYSMGGCYQFYIFLKAIFPQAKPFMSKMNNHVVTEIDGKLYDIDGEAHYTNDWFRPFTEEDHEMAKEWSFSRNHLLSAGECKHCGEPITLDVFINEESIL